MKIGIVGSDDRALAIGRMLVGCGHDVTFGDPKWPSRAEQAAAATGAGIDLPYRQAMKSDILLFAVPREEVDRAVTAIGSGAEAVIVDAVDGKPAKAPYSGAEILAHKLDTHRVVRALIVLPQAGATVPICGDDPIAKAVVDEALHTCGCHTSDRGPLSNAPELEAPAAA